MDKNTNINDVINSMPEEARNILATVAYELATGYKALETLNEEQKDVMCAVIGKLIFEPAGLDEDDDEEKE